MTLHTHHHLHPNSLQAYYAYLDEHLTHEERCYDYIRRYPLCTDDEVAKGVFGSNARRQDAAPRITKLIEYGKYPFMYSTKKHLGVRESGRRYVKRGKKTVPVRTLEIINAPEQKVMFV